MAQTAVRSNLSQYPAKRFHTRTGNFARWEERKIPLSQEVLIFLRNCAKELEDAEKVFYFPEQDITFDMKLDTDGLPIIANVLAGPNACAGKEGDVYVSKHALTRWLEKKIPLTQSFLSFIEKSSKTIRGTGTYYYAPKDTTVVLGFDKLHLPTVVTVYNGRKAS